MKWTALAALALVGLTLGASGCKEPWESEAQVRQLVEETGSLKAQNRTLEQERKQLEREVSSLEKENEKLKEQVAAQSALASQLKEEIERLKVGGVAAVKAVEKAVAAEAAAAEAAARQAAAVSSPDELRQERERRMAEITKGISDLELRKTNLRVQIGAGQIGVSALVRASLDARMIPPAGGFISRGQVYRREMRGGNECFVPIGPAVKVGDFRTQKDKDTAIEAAKAKLLPLFEEVRALDDELGLLQKELDGLKQKKISGAKPSEEIVVVVLKHKGTGETIKGAVTKQRINGLAVFNPTDGGTKLISLDEWETIGGGS